MATSPAPVVPTGSVDLAGVSVATSTPDSHPRAGMAYDPLGCAASAPLWFHPRSDGTYLWINAQRWMAAVPATLGTYSQYTVDSSPSWYVLDGPSGKRSPVPNDPIDIPMLTPATNVTVTAAASRPPQYLYLLNSATINSTPQAILQFFNCQANGSVAIVREETLPTPAGQSGTVVFSKGLQYVTPYLFAYGTDSAGKVYRIRKPWAKVGSNKNIQASTQNYYTLVGNQEGWEYFTGTGYDADPTKIAPVPGLITTGPMSFASWRNQQIATTVIANGGLRNAQVWVSKSGMPFTTKGTPIALGASSGSYLGVGMALQPQLAANLSALEAPAIAGIPYVISTRTGTSGAYALTNSWNMLTLTG